MRRSALISKAALAGVTLRELRFFHGFKELLSSAAQAGVINVMIPRGYFAIVTSFRIDSYPLDLAIPSGASTRPDRRVPYAVTDSLALSWLLDGAAITTQDDYQKWLNEIFIVAVGNKLSLAFETDDHRTALNISISGVFLPIRAAAKFSPRSLLQM